MTAWVPTGFPWTVGAAARDDIIDDQERRVLSSANSSPSLRIIASNQDWDYRRVDSAGQAQNLKGGGAIGGDTAVLLYTATSATEDSFSGYKTTAGTGAEFPPDGIDTIGGTAGGTLLWDGVISQVELIDGLDPTNTRIYPMNESTGSVFMCYDGNGDRVPAADATIQNFNESNWIDV